MIAASLALEFQTLFNVSAKITQQNQSEEKAYIFVHAGVIRPCNHADFDIVDVPNNEGVETAYAITVSMLSVHNRVDTLTYAPSPKTRTFVRRSLMVRYIS